MSVAKSLRVSFYTGAALLFIAALGAGWFYRQLHNSLPLLDGAAALPGLSAPAKITRDSLGVPTITAANRLDASRALGFLHAQDRFFQMDLLRRRAAGELAELFGKAAVSIDKDTRIHNFRTVARASFALLPDEQKRILEAYTAGVNSGLSALSTRPFEYIVLRTPPAPWLPEDSILVIHAMWLDLQGSNWTYEQSLNALREKLGAPALAFFAPALAPDDAALDGSSAPLPPTPGPLVINLRRSAPSSASSPADPSKDRALDSGLSALDCISPTERLPIGSNNFALSGVHTANGAALLANDMHLSLSVPNTWYRASLDFADASGLQPTRTHITGVTLPGTPAIVAGSNGHIAWGFTNAYADTTDLVAIASSEISEDFFMRNGKTLPFEKRTELITVKGEHPISHEVRLSPWGPLVGRTAQGRDLALKWLAHDPAATNFTLLQMESASTIPAAITIAHRCGIPAQNLLIADRDGHIAYTLAGQLPRRINFDGRLPVNWSYGDRYWDGLVPENQLPVFSSSPASEVALSTFNLQLSTPDRLSTANQRTFGGEIQKLLGDGGYDSPARAQRIKKLLSSLEHAAPRDLLAIQLDTQADHLTRWHTLLLSTLSQSPGTHPELLPALQAWDAHASINSTSYRLVRSFRSHVTARALNPIFASCTALYPNFNFGLFRYEPALEQILKEKPLHLLHPDYDSWEALFLAAVDDVARELKDEGLSPGEATWGQRNTARLQHPLSRVLPGFLAKLLDLPADQLPGDNDVPRVLTPHFGASERFVVSPGHEEEGIFHMPGGQSGHPLSPFYRAGHDAWVKGEPSPFLSGPTQHTLTLTP